MAEADREVVEHARLASSAAWPLSRSLHRPLASWRTSIERHAGR